MVKDKVLIQKIEAEISKASPLAQSKDSDALEFARVSVFNFECTMKALKRLVIRILESLGEGKEPSDEIMRTWVITDIGSYIDGGLGGNKILFLFKSAPCLPEAMIEFAEYIVGDILLVARMRGEGLEVVPGALERIIETKGKDVVFELTYGKPLPNSQRTDWNTRMMDEAEVEKYLNLLKAGKILRERYILDLHDGGRIYPTEYKSKEVS